jgi:hypothetical protein
MEARGRGLLLLLLLLTAAAGAILVTEDRRSAHAEQFQRLVGGVGFGPALDLSGCAFGFDPRLDGGCAEESGPIPGGACFCPRHAGSVFYYAPLERGAPLPAEEADATPP